jgi:hypothetical protein
MYYITDVSNYSLVANDYKSAEFLFHKLENCNVSYIDNNGLAILYIKHPKNSNISIYRFTHSIDDLSLINNYASNISSYKLKYIIYDSQDSILDNNIYEYLIDLKNTITYKFSEIKDIIVTNDDNDIIAKIFYISSGFPVLTIYKLMSFENLKDILYVYNKIWLTIRN